MTTAVVSTRTYVGVVVALLVLTAVTIGAAYLDLGRFNPLVALTIAGTKATLVGLFFMHLRYSGPLTRLSAAGGLVVLGILIGLMLVDFEGRRDDPNVPRWEPEMQDLM